MFADWTDRIAAGEVPPAPPRPQGIERNVVITEWDWADPKAYLHDVVSTDRRNPTLNANGPIYGVARAERRLPAGARSGDATRSSQVPLTVRDPNTPPTPPADAAAVAVLGRRGDLDEQEQRPQPDARRARAASGSRRRSGRRTIPTFCKAGSSHPSAKLFPMQRVRPPARDVRPEDEEAHAHQHLLRHAPPDVRRGREQHAVDERRRAGGRLAQHEDVRRDAATKRSRRAGRRSSSTPTATASATRTSSRISRSIRRRTSASAARFYAVAPAPDGSVWGSVLGFPGRDRPARRRARIRPRRRSPKSTSRRSNNPKAPVQGFSPRGMDVDRNGVVWAALASGHLASFDRRKCKGPLNGPTATGQHCPEGWTLYTEPLPQFKGVTDVGQRRGELLHLGRSVRHARARREHADQHRQRVRRAARAEGRQVGRAARAVSDRASTRSGWTAASTIRTPAGRARGCGRRSARARRSTWRRARARRARSCTSSCGPTRSPGDASACHSERAKRVEESRSSR